MKLFISWSGKQSHAVAKALHEWITLVIPSAKPWVSGLDIPVGARWFNEVMEQLETTDFCIICLTPDNMRSPWLYFEAGAIAARHKEAKVCGFLTGVNPSQISGPIAQFQCAQSDADGVWSLVKEISRSVADNQNEEGMLRNSFELQWPRLREQLREALLLYDPRAAGSEVETDAPESVYKLSEEARNLLVEGAADRNGVILMVRTMSGLTVQTNGRQLCDTQDARTEAKWQRAVRDLIQQGLIEGRGHKGEVFNLTAEGFRLADELRPAQSEKT